MAERRPLVVVSGVVQELPGSDTLPGMALPAGTVVGQVLKWDGTDWVPGTDETGGGGGGGTSTAGRMEIPIGAGSMAPSASGGCSPLTNIASGTNFPDIQTLNFHQTTQQHAQFAF